MSQVIFNSAIDLVNYGTTPSVGGYTVAYDFIDGIIKQKDSNGIITPLSGSTDLEGTLTLGNYSGTYSIVMGTATEISSIYGSGKLRLDYGNTSSVGVTATYSNYTIGLTTSVYSTGSLSLPIPDQSLTGNPYNFILATLSVSDDVIPTEVLVYIDITHDYLSDLVINLKAPNGNVINLGYLGLPWYQKTVSAWFSTDTTKPYIWTAVPPYSGVYRFASIVPAGSTASWTSNQSTIGGLRGSYYPSTYGNWVLYVEDNWSYYTGTFSKFETYFKYASGEQIGTISETRRDGLFVRNYRDDTLNARRTNMIVSSTTFSAYVGTSTYSTYIENVGNRFTLGHRQTGIGGGKINVIDSGNTWNTGSTNKAFLHLNTFGSNTAHGVRNSVIVGGQGLWASQSYTTYLGNWVNINNRYTLPNTDGKVNQVLMTNGAGTVSWVTFSVLPSLSEVLNVGSYSGNNHILMATNRNLILGTNSTLTSVVNPLNVISLDYNTQGILISPNGAISLSTDSSLLMHTQSATLNASILSVNSTTASVTTADLQGLKYTADYNATFVTYSLITKSYVDTYGGGYDTHLIAYVDPNKGSDATGAVGKPNRPYQTVAAAMFGITGSAYGSEDRGLIHLRKGNYTTVARLENYVDYYCEDGVVFTKDGFRDFSAVTSNVYGAASFVGPDASLIPIILNYASKVRFNFNYVDNAQAFCRVYGGVTASLVISGNRIDSACGAGYGMSFEGPCDVKVYVKEYIKGAYNTIRFTNGFSGTAYVQAKNVYCDGTIGYGGTLTSTNAIYLNASTTGTLDLRADVSDLSPSYAGTGQAAVSIESGNVTVHGNIYSNVSTALRIANDSPSTPYVKYTTRIKGDVKSQVEAIWHDHSWMDVHLDGSFVRSEGLGSQTQSVYMGQSGSMYFNNAIIYNGLTGSSLIHVSTEDSMIGIYNSLGYSPGTEGNSINYPYPALDYTIGFSNFRSNKDNGTNITDLFDPSGFIYDPYLFVPNF